MKNLLKYFLLLSAIMLTSIVAQAQTHYEANIAIGAKGGITLSKVNFNPSIPQTLAQGIMAGAMFRYIEEKHFGIIAELNLVQRGWKEKFEGTLLSYSREFTYIQLPVMTHIFFGSDKFRGFFNAGPEVALMIGKGKTKSNFDYVNWSTIADQLTTGRETDQFILQPEHKFDYGITAGVGMEFIARNKHSFLLEGRFYYGLNDVFANHSKDAFSSSSTMNIMVTLGYFYRLK